MMDQIIEKVLSQGIWCCVAVFFIYHNNKNNQESQRFVRDEMSAIADRSTRAVIECNKVMKEVMEKL